MMNFQTSFKFVPQNLKDREELAKQRIQNVLSQKVIKGDLDLSEIEWITDLGMIEEVHGNLNLCGCKNLKSLGNLKVVHGDLDLDECINLKSLSNLKVVHDNVILTCCTNLKSLGNLQQCKGLWLFNSGINYIENKDLKVERIFKHWDLDKSWNSVKKFNQDNQFKLTTYGRDRYY